MPSIRNQLSDFNVNDSKNTRMEITNSFSQMDVRKDEIMHLFRYSLAAHTMVDLSKALKRPIRVLDIGCGEMHSVRMFYKSIIEKKSDILESYTGVDIDYKMRDDALEKYGTCYKACNADIIIKDLTTDPTFDVEDNYYDLIICFEFCEHIKQKFLPDILDEVNRVLNPDGKAIFSTPNSNGSNSKLPKDHIYEYSYEELTELFFDSGLDLVDSVGCCVNISKIPAEERDKLSHEIDRLYSAYGRNSAAASVAIAPLFPPTYCKNVIYHLKKDVS